MMQQGPTPIDLYRQPDNRPKRAKRALVWLRRDLRLDDHAALHAALTQADSVVLAFVFDREILGPLSGYERTADGLRRDRRVEFIWHSVFSLRAAAVEYGCAVVVRYDRPQQAIPALAQELAIDAVWLSQDYEPEAVLRDREVATTLATHGIACYSVKDHCVFHTNEVLTQQGRPFTVFTPYKNAWLKALHAYPGALTCYPSLAKLEERQNSPSQRALIAAASELASFWPSLESMGFATTNLLDLAIEPGSNGAQQTLEDFRRRMQHYRDKRDFPGVKGVSYLSVHFRFGTFSIRQAAGLAHQQLPDEGAMSWLNELIWRDFYIQILHHFPHATARSFKPVYDRIVWRTGAEADQHYAAWCAGQTGYPLVDAAMRQLNHTGYMHNRLRMVAASFLCKHLGLDWRLGEQYFAMHLNDFDLSANNGGWQWAASSGCDAQPYFRIFNPITQSEKFDAEGHFIRRYCPEITKLPSKYLHAPWLCPPMILQDCGIQLGQHYPYPIVDHAQARAETLARFEVVKTSDSDKA